MSSKTQVSILVAIALLFAAGILLYSFFFAYPINTYYIEVSSLESSLPLPEDIVQYNINTVTFEELLLIPGIGESTAQKIISFRDENLPLTSLEDLLYVDGIGESKIETYKKYLYVQ